MDVLGEGHGLDVHGAGAGHGEVAAALAGAAPGGGAAVELPAELHRVLVAHNRVSVHNDLLAGAELLGQDGATGGQEGGAVADGLGAHAAHAADAAAGDAAVAVDGHGGLAHAGHVHAGLGDELGLAVGAKVDGDDLGGVGGGKADVSVVQEITEMMRFADPGIRDSYVELATYPSDLASLV